MKKSEGYRNYQKKNDYPKNSAKSGAGEKGAYIEPQKKLSHILSEVEDITVKLNNLIGNKKSEELYGESFRSLRKEIEYIKDDLTSRMQGSGAGARQNESPYENRERSTEGRHRINNYEERDNDYTSELKNANILLIKEILERRYIESELKKSLNEKDLLFKEVHHRVKNNLQIISSLLNLQSRQIRDPEAVASFNESKNRIRSIATLHEQLYRSKDLSNINFTAYLHNITNYLLHSYGAGSGYIKVVVNAERIYLDLSTAIPCGLIVNELVSNAITHGFPRGKMDEISTRGEIRIDFKKAGDKYYLSVSNNGVRFPEDLDIKNSSTLGLELVSSLSRQLRGSISLLREEVTEFRLEFAA